KPGNGCVRRACTIRWGPCRKRSHAAPRGLSGGPHLRFAEWDPLDGAGWMPELTVAAPSEMTFNLRVKIPKTGDAVREKIEKALRNLQPALATDGFVLRLESVDSDGSVSVAVDATADACGDCLISDGALVKILERAIREEAPSVG